MKFRPRPLLVLAACFAAFLVLAAVACGGDEEKETPAATGTPKAEQTPSGRAGELPDIADYPGAKNTFSGTVTGESGLLPIPGTSPLEPKEFGETAYTVFQTDDSADKVFDFYKKEFKGWKEEWTWSTEVAGEKARWGLWSKDDGSVAAWVLAGEGSSGRAYYKLLSDDGSEDGTTSVTVVRVAKD